MSNEKWKMGQIFLVFLEYLNFNLSVQAKKKKKCGEIRKKTKESLRTPYFNIAVPVKASVHCKLLSGLVRVYTFVLLVHRSKANLFREDISPLSIVST